MSKHAKKKNSGLLGQFVMILSYFATGACAGITIARLLPQVKDGLSFPQYMAYLLLAIVLVYAAIYVHLVLHEAGHLLFGLLTGYGFSSFRISSFMWVKTPEGIKLKRYKLAGTGGQCLLTPPAWTERGIPFKLYNLGGVLVNLLLSALFLGMFFLAVPGFWQDFCLMMCVGGIALALSNGIPLQVGPTDNDGRNIIMLGKSLDAQRAFWIQLRINALMAQGMRLKDLPADLFEMPADEQLSNTMHTAVALFCCNRLMDEHRLEEALERLEHLLGMECISGALRLLVQSDTLYCSLVLGVGDDDRLQGLRNKELLKFYKMMSTNPSVLRTEYAWALLHDHDDAAARKKLDAFDKQATKHPYAQEIDSERELIALAQEKQATA